MLSKGLVLLGLMADKGFTQPMCRFKGACVKMMSEAATLMLSHLTRQSDFPNFYRSCSLSHWAESQSLPLHFHAHPQSLFSSYKTHFITMDPKGRVPNPTLVATTITRGKIFKGIIRPEQAYFTNKYVSIWGQMKDLNMLFQMRYDSPVCYEKCLCSSPKCGAHLHEAGWTLNYA